MSAKALAQQAIDEGKGIVRLAPTWVPRSFCIPGRRIKLHPGDYYALGGERGGIDERWFASTTVAANEGAPDDEGLSYAVHDGQRFTLRDAVSALGGDLIGSAVFDKYNRWPVYSKFFDNMGPFLNFQRNAIGPGNTGGNESYPSLWGRQIRAGIFHLDHTLISF